MSVAWLPALCLFVALLLAIALFALAVSGHFPAEQRSAPMRTRAGQIILRVSVPVVGLATAYAIVFAVGRLPWPAAIIGGGSAVLAAPLILQQFPDSFVNGRRGLVVLAGLAAALAVAAHRIAW